MVMEFIVKNKMNKKHYLTIFLVVFAVFSFLMINWDQSL